MRDAVGDIGEEELLATAHARVPDDDDVGVFVDCNPHDGSRRVLVDHDPRTRLRPGHLDRGTGQFGFGVFQSLAELAPIRDDLDEHELRVVAVGERGRPIHRAIRGRR